MLASGNMDSCGDSLIISGTQDTMNWGEKFHNAIWAMIIMSQLARNTLSVFRAVDPHAITKLKLRRCSKMVMEVFHSLLSSLDVLGRNTPGNLDMFYYPGSVFGH